MGVGAEGVDEGSRVIVVGEDDGEAPLAEVLGEASRRCSPKMLANPLLPKCWGSHVIVVRQRCWLGPSSLSALVCSCYHN